MRRLNAHHSIASLLLGVDCRCLRFLLIADRVALPPRFRALGINNGDAVGIFMPKTVEYSIAYAAALKAGGAYTILDVSLCHGEACCTPTSEAQSLPGDHRGPDPVPCRGRNAALGQSTLTPCCN